MMLMIKKIEIFQVFGNKVRFGALVDFCVCISPLFSVLTSFKIVSMTPDWFQKCYIHSKGNVLVIIRIVCLRCNFIGLC